MAKFNEKTGYIELSEEDKELFRETGREVAKGYGTISTRIMKAILPEELYQSFNLKKYK